MLLNTVLTVRAHAANSHKNIGWEEFTGRRDPRLKRAGPPDGIYPLGTPGADEKPMLTNPKHLILESPHPSPLSAYRGFFGSRPFSKTNKYLKENGIEPIDWQIENIN